MANESRPQMNGNGWRFGIREALTGLAIIAALILGLMPYISGARLSGQMEGEQLGRIEQKLDDIAAWAIRHDQRPWHDTAGLTLIELKSHIDDNVKDINQHIGNQTLHEQDLMKRDRIRDVLTNEYGLRSD